MAEEQRPAGYDPDLWALVAPLRAALQARPRAGERTRGWLALQVWRHRSRVSRALSGKELPPRHLVIEMARVLEMDVAAAESNWERVAEQMSDPQKRQAAATAGGAPPAQLPDCAAFRAALRTLLLARGISQREIERRNPWLCRSTVGAQMRGTRGLRLEMVTAIVQACGVHSEAAQAWADAWRRHCQADLKERRARQRAGYEQSLWWY